MSKEKRGDRFEPYPRPSETDKQLRDQPEFINEQPDEFTDQPVSNAPEKNTERVSDEPGKEIRE